jgi:hypothetical protein
MPTWRTSIIWTGNTIYNIFIDILDHENYTTYTVSQDAFNFEFEVVKPVTAGVCFAEFKLHLTTPR